MAQVPQHDVTLLLQRWTDGDRASMDRLIELVYPEMQKIALRYLQHERVDHTLQSTALVHEAYMRLVQQPDKQWANRSHFFAVASRIIRGILVDYARAKLTVKRGAGAAQISLSDAMIGQDPGEVDLLDLDNALNALQKLDPQQSQIVEMRFFGGLSIEETAEVLKVSPSTVKRDWIMAKTWIRRQMGIQNTPDKSDD
jgi:RNA polymerase sigma factor (TIGR02999 family)